MLQARAGYKGAVLRNADKLALVLGPDAQALLDIVRDCPANAENLLLKMLYGLTGMGTLMVSLIQFALWLLTRKVVFLLWVVRPVFSGVSLLQSLDDSDMHLIPIAPDQSREDWGFGIWRVRKTLSLFFMPVIHCTYL